MVGFLASGIAGTTVEEGDFFVVERGVVDGAFVVLRYPGRLGLKAFLVELLYVDDLSEDFVDFRSVEAGVEDLDFAETKETTLVLNTILNLETSILWKDSVYYLLLIHIYY